MTSMLQPAEAILKTDKLGRVKTPPERRAKLLDEFERSGLSGPKFAALAGLKYQTFAGWVLRRRKRAAANKTAVKPADQVRWLEAVVTDAQPRNTATGTPLKLHLPGGTWIEIADTTHLPLAVALVQALGKASLVC